MAGSGEAQQEILVILYFPEAEQKPVTIFEIDKF